MDGKSCTGEQWIEVSLYIQFLLLLATPPPVMFCLTGGPTFFLQDILCDLSIWISCKASLAVLLGLISLLSAARHRPGDCYIEVVQAVFDLTVFVHILVQYRQYSCCRSSGIPFSFMFGLLLTPDVT
jgi:hypothetical protein